MTTQEAARQAWRNLKGKPLKDKITHIVTYYWIPIVACLVVLGIATSLVYSAVTRKETVLFGYCINAKPTDKVEAFQQGFIEYAAITEEQEVMFLANLSTDQTTLGDALQALTIHTAAQEVDFIVSDRESCQMLLRYGYYWNLSEMPEAYRDTFSDYFLYAEKALLEQDYMQEDVVLPTFGDRESFSDPVPVALRLPEGNKLAGAYSFPKGELVMLLIPNSQRLSTVFSFLEFITE